MMNIDIVLAPDDNYAKHCAVVMASVLKNASSKSRISFWILYSDLSKENIAKLSSLRINRDYEIKFLKVKDENFKGFPSMKYISVNTWYRLNAASLLPKSVKKFLYLDCDVVVRRDLSELLKIDMKNFLLAGAIDTIWQRYAKKMGLPKNYPYFNAGVILVNAKLWREENIENKIFKYLKENPEKLSLMDQNIILLPFKKRV